MNMSDARHVRVSRQAVTQSGRQGPALQQHQRNRLTVPDLVDGQVLGLGQLPLLIKRLFLEEEADVVGALKEVGVRLAAGREGTPSEGPAWWWAG